jgi:hypothetical protein
LPKRLAVGLIGHIDYGMGGMAKLDAALGTCKR